jgi:EpsI family protein
MACVGVLMIEIWIFARMQKQPFLQIFGLDIPEVPQLQALASRLRPNRQLVTATAVIAVAALLSLTVSRPAPLAPERQSLSTFPLSFGEWQGRDQAMESIYTDALQVSDYLLAEFSMPEQPAPIGVWIAWYDSQVQGASVHSPQACLPGGGWQIEKFETVEIPGAMADGGPLPVNRVEIGLGEQRQLVYYWFAQRGRVLTNEFLVKWYIFWDGLTRNRTDGALVRMTTFVTSPADLPAAEARLQAFVRDAQPKLAYYLPGAEVPTRPLAARPKVAAAGNTSTAAR